MNQAKLDRLKKLLEVVGEDSFSHNDAIRFFKALTNSLNAFKKDLMAEVKKAKNGSVEQVNECVSKIKPLITQIKEIEEKVKQVKVGMPTFADIYQIVDEIVIPNSDEIEENIEKNLPKHGDKLRDGLELLSGDDRLDKKAIKGIEEIEEKMEELSKKIVVNNQPAQSIVGRDIITDIDISESLDGVTKTFDIQAIYNIISVSLSSFPYGSLRKNIDYTFTPTSITFTDEIVADAQLSAGQKCIITAILP